MTEDPWDQATFAGTAQAQARRIADLSPDQRLALLDELLDLAQASGALHLARLEKQRALDELWA